MRKLIILFFMTLSIALTSATVQKETQDSKIGSKAVVKSKLPHEQVFDGLIKAGVDTASAKIMTAQASFESGYFKSQLTKNSKNCFAIHYTKKRKTYAYSGGGRAEGNNKFARFHSLDSAAQDFPLFLSYLGVDTKLKSIGDYTLKIQLKHYYGFGDINKSPKTFWKEYNQYTNGVRVHYHKLWTK